MLHPEQDPSFKNLLVQQGLKSLGYDPGTPDNWWGSKSEAAYQAFLAHYAAPSSVVYPPRTVIASTFADPGDVSAFKRCKLQGKSDQECFKVGDNGIGFWGDDTTLAKPMVALPPEHILQRFESLAKARLAPVRIDYSGKSINAFLGDIMPHLENIKNGAGIDLNPEAAKQLGITDGGMVKVTWSWV